jgi:histidyl-tRNA synthetase
VVEPDAPRDLVPSLLKQLRDGGIAADTDYAGRSLKGQLTQAQRLGAATVVIAHERGFTVRKRGEQDVEVARVDELAL